MFVFFQLDLHKIIIKFFSKKNAKVFTRKHKKTKCFLKIINFFNFKK